MAVGTYVYPNRYTTTACVKRRLVSVINPLERSVPSIGQLHSEVVPCEEENRWLWGPVLLIVATLVRRLRYHHPRTFLREECELWAVWSNTMFEGWTVDFYDCTVVSLRIYQKGCRKCGETSAHETGDHTKDGIHHKLPSVKRTRMPLCDIGNVEGSGEIRGRDGTVPRRLGLTTGTVRHLLGRRKSGNVRSLRCSSGSKTPWSGCWNKSLTARSPPAN